MSRPPFRRLSDGGRAGSRLFPVEEYPPDGDRAGSRLFPVEVVMELAELARAGGMHVAMDPSGGGSGLDAGQRAIALVIAGSQSPAVANAILAALDEAGSVPQPAPAPSPLQAGNEHGAMRELFALIDAGDADAVVDWVSSLWSSPEFDFHRMETLDAVFDRAPGLIPLPRAMYVINTRRSRVMFATRWLRGGNTAGVRPQLRGMSRADQLAMIHAVGGRDTYALDAMISMIAGANTLTNWPCAEDIAHASALVCAGGINDARASSVRMVVGAGAREVDIDFVPTPDTDTLLVRLVNGSSAACSVKVRAQILRVCLYNWPCVLDARAVAHRCFPAESEWALNAAVSMETHTDTIRLRQVRVRGAAAASRRPPPIGGEDVKCPRDPADGTTILDEASMCKICMDNVARVCLVPCGHIAQCGTCCNQILADLSKEPACPICRAVFAHAVAVHRS